MIDYFTARGPYMLFVVLVAAGVYMLVSRPSYLKMMVGLYLFQTGIILLFILLGAHRDGTVPIIPENGAAAMANPLPHALMLTAIVVGVATLGVGLAILRRMNAEEGNIDDAVAADPRRDVSTAETPAKEQWPATARKEHAGAV